MHDLSAWLRQQQQAQLYRGRRQLDSAQGPVVVSGGREYLNFCSNDYLGLAAHPEVVTAYRDAARRYGVGSGASHLVCGHMAPHHALEEALAEFVQRPRALLFSTGYMANLGVVSALTSRHDTVLEDRLNHASLIDAAQLSRATLQRYAHGDTAALAAQLEHAKGFRLVASDGVFSMDGDLAPLPGLAGTCRRQDAWLMVDDAHGIGVLGETGRGSLEHFDLGTGEDVPVLMGTLGKALGTFGAFVAGSEDLIETLIQKARTYIYTTALPPAVAAATLVALRLVQQESWRRTHLLELVQRFRSGARQLGLPLAEAPYHIQPLLVGDPGTALDISRALEARGILITAIRPPTVPENTARLRITFSAAHGGDHVDRLLEALAACRVAAVPGSTERA